MTARVATLNSAETAGRTGATPLPSPAALAERLPIGAMTRARIAAQREAIRAVLRGDDPRLMVVVGPCSVHDPQAALDYGRRLARLADELSDELLIVMRVYVEKPRTTIGWKGLLHDPDLDGVNDLARGLAVSRELLIELADLGLPIATELLTPIAADYLEDTLAWAAIGARTTESQTHRERMSGLDLAVGFKNGTEGEIGSACDAMAAAASPQCYFGIDATTGAPAAVATPGNPDTHLILRGGRSGPNYDAGAVAAAVERLTIAGQNPRVVVDCSHGNSGKQAARQPAVLADLVARRQSGESGVVGVMLESNLAAGKQSLGGELAYGQSVTDDCLGWDDTEATLRETAAALGGNRDGG
ncbi:3-deoxy-7-phosphoheptulonate synthase [Salinisphaera sp. Q1T1-3]|uniref:3-deoxy-7-phosphoheptulonate synthase n=1 Tax=Salinisphaera sp. Q1T1-3 TaxID=2321229 RepID=UPI000E71E547|nr:3-deoxy-7-phosphoheptulonate synthase [Salinisphaera sp. Q1T1-3]RJS94086.1 3-deoxy-7-phosphoheptulonate synthase [Salinisphaera sp. Q1T1-3]